VSLTVCVFLQNGKFVLESKDADKPPDETLLWRLEYNPKNENVMLVKFVPRNMRGRVVHFGCTTVCDNKNPFCSIETTMEI
jgi:hypothetical protein